MAAISSGATTAGSTSPGRSRSAVISGVSSARAWLRTPLLVYGGMIGSLLTTLTASRACASTTRRFPVVSRASVLARNRVPMLTPCAPRERRGEACASGDTARGQHRDVAGEGDRLGDQTRVEPIRRAPGLAALRDDHVGPCGQRVLGLVPVHHLLHPEDPGVVRPGDEVGGTPMWKEITLGRAANVAANAASSKGRFWWFTANGRSGEAPQASPLLAQVVG